MNKSLIFYAGALMLGYDLFSHLFCLIFNLSSSYLSLGVGTVIYGIGMHIFPHDMNQNGYDAFWSVWHLTSLCLMILGFRYSNICVK
jgi:hypothetical protein